MCACLCVCVCLRGGQHTYLEVRALHGTKIKENWDENCESWTMLGMALKKNIDFILDHICWLFSFACAWDSDTHTNTHTNILLKSAVKSPVAARIIDEREGRATGKRWWSGEKGKYNSRGLRGKKNGLLVESKPEKNRKWMNAKREELVRITQQAMGCSIFLLLKNCVCRNEAYRQDFTPESVQIQQNRRGWSWTFFFLSTRQVSRV